MYLWEIEKFSEKDLRNPKPNRSKICEICEICVTYISRGFSPNDRIGQDQQNLRDYPPILLPFLLLKRKSHNFLAVSIKKCIFAADLQTRQRVSDRMRIVYLQLPLFDKHTEAECMDIFDCWIYIMKNMNMFEQMPFSEKYPVFRKLAEIGDLRKLSREELELYDEDIKNMRDIYATRKFDEKRGMEKGMAKGRAEGKAEGKAEVARNLLAMGMSWTQIIQATGLTEDQLKQLQS